MPSSVSDIAGHEELALLGAMMKRNDFSGFPAYVAIDGDRVVGIAVIQDGYYTDFTKVWCLEVAKDYRNRGIGRMLMDMVAQYHPSIKLVAKRDAFGFYQKMGFAFVGEPHPKSNVCYMVRQPG